MGRNQILRQMADGTWTKPQKPRLGDYVNCLTCGKEFYRQPAYIAQDRRYCSQPCWNVAQRAARIFKTCAYCGASFPVRPSETAIEHCSRACMFNGKITRPTGRIHNGRPVRKNRDGYVLLWEPEHPNKSLGGWQFEHRLVAEQTLGRYLTSEEHVDHINAVKDDNDPSNLQVLSPSDHSKKTNADNLGALKVLRARIAEYEAELEAARKQLSELTD